MRAHVTFPSLLPLSFLAVAIASGCGSDPAPPEKIDPGQHASGGSSTTGAGGSAGSVDATGGMAGDTSTGGSSAGGEGGAPAASYPAGPYGLTTGTVIHDDTFVGLVNPVQSKFDVSNLVPISLHDFYNPGGADPNKPKVLVVMIGALWCGPCIEEAMVGKKNHDYWNKCGVQFMHTVYQDVNQMPAQASDLQQWAHDYNLDYPTVLDPSSKLGAYFNQGAFPNNIVIDTTTMTFLYVDTGLQDFGPDNIILKNATVGTSCSP